MTAKGRQRLIAISLAFALSAAAGEALAVACTSIATGNWNAAATWSCGIVPGAADTVTIAATHTVTITAAAAATSVTFAAAGGAANLTHNAGISLTVGGGGVIINSSSNTNSTKAWNINAGSATVNGNVTLAQGSANNSRIARIQLTTGTLDINGNLTMTVGNNARAVIAATGAANIFVSGNFTLTSGFGTLTSAAGSTFTYDTAAAATVATGAAISYRDLTINKPGGTATTASTGNLTVLDDLTVQAGTFNITGINVTVSDETFVFGTLAITSTTGTKTFTNDIYIRSGGTWNNSANEDVTFSDDVNIDSGGTFNAGNGVTSIGDDFYNNGTFNAGTGTVSFTGSQAAEIGGSNATTFNNLTVNKSANNLSIAPGTPAPTVNGTFTLTSGRLVSGGTCASPVPVIIGATGTVAGGSATSYVQGAMRKNFSAGATLNFLGGALNEFPVGTASAFSPIQINAGTTSTAGNLIVCVTATDHPQVTTPVPSTGIDAGKSVNRFWSLTNTGLNTTAAQVDATFKFVAADVDVGAITGNFIVQRWNGAIWNPTTLVTAAPTSTRAQNINLTAGTNEIAIGEPLAPPAPGGFNAYEPSTAPGAIAGVIRTKVAGVAISVDLIALNSTKTAILTTFTGTVKVELLDASNNAGPLDVNGCRPTWTVIQTPPTVTFAAADNGRKNTSFTETDVWREARIRVTFPAAGPPSAIGCSNDNFAIRPANFSVAVTDTTWATAGTARALNNVAASGGNVHKAGQPFTITVTPSPGTATNYNGDPTVSALACTLPTPCANGTLTLGGFSGSGTRVSNNATYTEAGAFNLTLIDQTFASVDSADGTPADCSAAGQYVCHSGAPLAVGRFVPDRFAVTAVTAPVFRTTDATDAACTTPPSGPVRSFTYIGQFFGYQTSPVAMITAQNASGGTTTNYRGALWKLTGASASQAFANSPVETLDTTQILAPTVTETPDTGTGTLTANAADKLAFTRDNASPRAPFNANLSLTWSVSDASENAPDQGTITTTAPLVFNGGGSGIAFDGGDFNAGAGLTGGKTLLYGRLRLSSANGSQLVPLAVTIETQYWNGTFFVTNAADHCATLVGANIAMANFQGSLGPLASCKTQAPASITFSAGRGNLSLTAPGSANIGSVDLTIQLGSGTFGANSCVVGVSPPPQTTNGANRLYLQGNWTGGAFDQNPTARATFGVFKGSEEVIFIRENF